MSLTRHIPVLVKEVVEGLDIQPGSVVVDATIGGGGHAEHIARRLGPAGFFIGLDRDPAALNRAQLRLKNLDMPPRMEFIHANFDQLRACLDRLDVPAIHGIVADLGFSSDQIEAANRGLSFQLTGPLDMRLDPGEEQTAADILASWNERDLADLFWHLGEERFSRRIARKIVEQREDQSLESTVQLAELIRGCVPKSTRGIDPATRVFQALRIAVNDELGSLNRFLAALPQCLQNGGRAGIISFHSLEDRMVKKAFKENDCWEPLTKKPIEASEEEVASNPRSRSAKLRIARLVRG